MTTHRIDDRSAGWWALCILGLAATLVLGCDALEPSPGHDFEVRVLDAAPIPAIGKINVPVSLAIAGCDAFAAQLRSGSGGHDLAVERQPDGTYRTEIPVVWLRGEDATCGHDALDPLEIEAQLAVTCLDGNRTRVADLTVAYGAATRATDFSGRSRLLGSSLQYLFPGEDPLGPYALFPSWLQGAADLEPLRLGGIPLAVDADVYVSNPLLRPRLAVGEAALVLTSGCGDPAWCPDVPVSDELTLPGERLFGINLAGTGGFAFWHSIWVPAHVVDAAFTSGNELLVLSQAYEDPRGWALPSGSVVSRVTLLEAGAADVDVLGYFPGEWIQTRFSRTDDGALAFASLYVPAGANSPEDLPLEAVLHTSDGYNVSTRSDITGDLWVGHLWRHDGGLSYGSLQLSPDGSTLVANGHWVGSADGAWLPVDTEDYYPGDGESGGAAWLDDGIALWNGTPVGMPVHSGWTEVFAAAAPHERLYRYDVTSLAGTAGSPALRGATAVGEHLVLTTSTGVRILGPDGALVGGSDPLPCRLSPATVAVQTGPTQVAIGAGDFVYVFDVSSW